MKSASQQAISGKIFKRTLYPFRLPEKIAFDPLLHSECLGGALYTRDFVSMAKKAGFKDPRELSQAPITIRNDDIEKKVGCAKFFSITYRLFKLPDLVSEIVGHITINNKYTSPPG